MDIKQNKIRIVNATVGDAAAIGQIQTQTWLDSYVNTEEGVTSQDIKSKISLWEKEGDSRIREKIQQKDSRTWLAKEGEKIVGFIGVRKAHNLGEIEALHILPGYQGRGLGKELLQYGLSWLGDIPIKLSAVSYNKRAIEFYTRFGFRETGIDTDDPIELPGGKIISKIVMQRG